MGRHSGSQQPIDPQRPTEPERPIGAIHLEVRREWDVHNARYLARRLAHAAGFDLYDATAIETAVSELAMNIVRHAGHGTMVVRPLPDGLRPVALEVVARNLTQGALPAASARAPRGVREGLGIGLSGVRRLMDAVQMTAVEGFLEVTAVKWLPGHRRVPPYAGDHGPTGVVRVSERYQVDIAAAPAPRRVGAAAQAGGDREHAGQHPGGDPGGNSGDRSNEHQGAGGATWGPSGDGYVVVEHDGGLLCALFDTLGHGPEAHQVAFALKEVLLGAVGLEAEALVRSLHGLLKGTRGACLLVVAVDAQEQSIRWAGAGNVRGRLWHSPASTPAQPPVYLLSQPGIVGYNATSVTGREQPVTPPATLLMVTDGVQDEALDRPPTGARAVLERFRRPSDDATVLVVRWGGQG